MNYLEINCVNFMCKKKAIIKVFPVLLLLFICLSSSRVFSQVVQPPSDEFLFLEDQGKKKKQKRERLAELAARKKRLSERKQQNLPFDIDAEKISFDTTEQSILAEGDVIIGYPTGVVEADKGKFNLQNKRAELSGDVRVGDVNADIITDSAKISLESGEGILENTSVYFPDGGYYVDAKRMEKIGEDRFIFEDVSFSTCDCPKEGSCLPWRLRAGDGKITRNGYGHIYDSTLEVHDIPLFYFPYLVFPAKTDRQSGLLAPTFGNGRNSGFKLGLPFFWAINESTDATITGHLETSIRAGFDLEFRKAFSRQHELEAGFLYLNESARGGDLLGTNITGLSDPELDKDRFGGYLEQSYEGVIGQSPLQIILDGAYVSDDLLLREFSLDKIGEEDSRFVSSRAVARGYFNDYISAELAVEYNQALITDDDFVFQRYPELTLNAFRTFRPFGTSPYGLRLINSSEITAINFQREKSFDGARFEVFQRLKTPFFYKNILEGALELNARASHYELSEDQVDPSSSQSIMDDFAQIESSSNRLVPGVVVTLGTAVEKVFNKSEDKGFLSKLFTAGYSSRYDELSKIKHGIEPKLTYRYVPSVDQSENPQFDSVDRLAEKNVLTYELIQRWFVRYDSKNPEDLGFEDIVTRQESNSRNTQSRSSNKRSYDKEDDEFDNRLSYKSPFAKRRRIREIASFRLAQSYDILEARENTDVDRSEFSDVLVDFTFFPNDYIRLKGESNIDVGEQELSSYELGAQFLDNRGDELRIGWNFIDSRVRQLESSLQLKLSEGVKFGVYSLYDDLDGEFVENRAGIRFTSECNCWIFDVDIHDRSNPDETSVNFRLTLVGLGEIGNSLFTTKDGAK